MKILLLTKYGRRAASTRHRYLQFLPYLQKEGIECVVSPLLEDNYLKVLFEGGGRHRAHLHYLEALVRRIHAILIARRFDRVVLHCEAFPYLPPLLERCLRGLGVPYIYDFDDAIFHQYDQHPNRWVRHLFANKVRQIIAGASDVIAGNEYLAEYARQANARVSVLPTVVDTDRYTVRDSTRFRNDTQPLVIGWVGSPSTAKFVRQQADALRAFCARHRARVVLVGSGPLSLPGVPLEIVPWREETEIPQIQSFDIGIMPLPDEPWARGKCGFKLIQYMACGLPVVASPVGVNTSIVDHGKNGFLASTTDEWIASLQALAGDASVRKGFGAQGRQKAVEQFSLRATAPRFVSVLRRPHDEQTRA